MLPLRMLSVLLMLGSVYGGDAIANPIDDFAKKAEQAIEAGDTEAAVHWYTKAASQGLVGSLTTLAMMYDEGNLVEQDKDKAKELLKKAGF